MEEVKQEVDPILRAENAAKRLEEANKKAEELISRQMLSGRSVAVEIPEKKEETPKEYAARIMKGKL